MPRVKLQARVQTDKYHLRPKPGLEPWWNAGLNGRDNPESDWLQGSFQVSLESQPKILDHTNREFDGPLD
jgi:hypothetical protein